MTTAATILLVEDDQSLLDGISDLLEVVDIGYEITVLTASNGQAGLKSMAERTPDLIISDIMMPKMGGFEFLEHLRKNVAWVHIPVIFLSARGTKEDIRAGRVSGAEMYITKPFDNEELLEMVKSQLDRAFELQQDRERRLDTLQRSIIQLLNHEFRTPLTYVTAYYDMLADSLSSQNIDNLQDYLRGIQVGAVRLTRLIDDFVKVMELRTGEAALRYRERAEPINNLAGILMNTCRQRQESTETNILIHCRLPAELPPVYGDATYLGEIADRLVENAIKFTVSKKHQNPVVVVSAGVRMSGLPGGRPRFQTGKLGEEATGGERVEELYFSVQDNGIGFPEHVRSQLFELFFQYNREQMEQQGSGSGLTVVKGLVELHGGRIEIESEVGIGSTFTVLLPVYKLSSQQPTSSTQELSTKKPATILLVEDEWYLLDGLRELLEIFESDYDLRILTASNGVEGLEILSRYQPDLIVTDIMMPKMDGYELLSQVRENPAWVHIPVIFLTARGERRDVLRGRSSGAEEYIVKPYDSDELLELVVKQLDRYFQVQGAIRQDFEQLKRGILDLLQPDFRLPLTSVSDHSQKLAISLEEIETDEDLKESLRGIQFASRRITTLVEDFIFLAESRTGEAVGSFNLLSRPTNASMILLEACDLCRVEANRQGVVVEYELDMNLPPAIIDYEKFRTAVQRLIETLIDFCASRQLHKVMAVSSFQDQFVQLSLSIEGSSFSAKTVEQINHLFEQEDVSRLELPEYDPNLVITRTIVDLHNGQIRLINHPGRSSAFVISLPVYQPVFELDQE